MEFRKRSIVVWTLALVSVVSAAAPIGLGVPRQPGDSLDRPTAAGHSADASIATQALTCSNCVVATIPVGSQPKAAATNPSTGDVYVANALSASVSVISDSTDSVIKTIPVGSSPIGIVYDPGNGEVYVDNAASGNVSVISGVSNSIIATVRVGSNPGPIAYDSEHGRLYVLNTVSTNLSVISDTTNTVVATVAVGGSATGPAGIVYDGVNGDLYISDMTASETVISAISTATNTFVKNITGFNRPVGMTFDPSNGDVYVANENGNGVSVVSGFDNTLVTWIPSYPAGSGPVAAAYDPANGELYFANGFHGGAGSVTAVFASNNTIDRTIPTGSATSGLTYDGNTNRISATNAQSNNASVISIRSTGPLCVPASVNAGTGPEAVALDTATREVYVGNSVSNNVSVITPTSHQVVTNVPAGSDPGAGLAYDPTNGMIYASDWSSANLTVINGTTHHVVTSIPTAVNPDGLVYDPGTGDLYVAQTLGGTLAVVKGSTNGVVGNITVGGRPRDAAYDPINGMLYVPQELNATVSVVNPGTDSVVKVIPVGTTPVAVTYDPALNDIYVSNAGSNDVSVISGATDSVIATIPVGIDPDEGSAFDPVTGKIYIGNAVSNNVSIIADSVNKVISNVPTGSQPRGIAIDPLDGTVYVANTLSNNVSLLSCLATQSHSVVFTEWGLTAGTSWSVIISGATYTSSSTDLTLSEPDGSYPFTVISPGGYVANPASGLVQLNGPSVTQIISFTELASSFQLSISPTGQSVAIPGTVSYGMTLSSVGGFVGEIAISYAYLPPDVTITPAALSQVNLGSGEVTTMALTILVNPGSIPGNYLPIVIATSGSDEVSVTISLQILGIQGLQNQVTFSTEPVNTQNQTCGLGKNYDCFSIQQNFWIFTPGDNGAYPVYWVQNVIDYEYDDEGSASAEGSVWVWSVNAAGDVPCADLSCTVGGTPSTEGFASVGRTPTFTVQSQLKQSSSGEDLAFSSSAGSKALYTGNVDAAALPLLLGSSYITETGCSNQVSAVSCGSSEWLPVYSPQLSIVGEGNYANAHFTSGAGLVTSSIQMSDSDDFGSATSSDVLCPVGFFGALCSSSSTGESESGLEYSHGASPDLMTISVPTTEAENQFVQFNDYVSQQMEGTVSTAEVSDGAAYISQTSPTGITVAITGSSAADGSPATVTSTAATPSQLEVGSLNLGNPQFFDIQVGSSPPLGTAALATVCISPAGGATEMEYYSGGAWNKAVDVAYSFATTCGTIPVSDLSGTLLVVGTTGAYTVSFTETGLPTGTTWYVNITDEPPLSSTGQTITTALPNGTYDCTIGSASTSFEASGISFTVNGTALPVSVTFSLVTYAVTFTETGLPSGTEWWVNITGESPLDSTGTTISMSLPNGTFTYSVSASGHSTRTGNVTVNGVSPSPVMEDFTSSAPSGLPALDYAFIGVAVVVAAIAIAVVLLRRRR